jgi:hypothetical protein
MLRVQANARQMPVRSLSSKGKILKCAGVRSSETCAGDGCPKNWPNCRVPEDGQTKIGTWARESGVRRLKALKESRQRVRLLRAATSPAGPARWWRGRVCRSRMCVCPSCWKRRRLRRRTAGCRCRSRLRLARSARNFGALCGCSRRTRRRQRYGPRQRCGSGSLSESPSRLELRRGVRVAVAWISRLTPVEPTRGWHSRARRARFRVVPRQWRWSGRTRRAAIIMLAVRDSSRFHRRGGTAASFCPAAGSDEPRTSARGAASAHRTSDCAVRWCAICCHTGASRCSDACTGECVLL